MANGRGMGMGNGGIVQEASDEMKKGSFLNWDCVSKIADCISKDIGFKYNLFL
jgi:hypothetical protein